MAYIESHQALARHPKTLRLARRLGTSKHETIGLLHMLWWWCLDYAPDGDLTAFSADEIAMAIEFAGDADQLLVALIDAKWLDSDGAGLHVHDWCDYGGKLLTRKKANANRMKSARATTNDETETHVQDTCDARAEHVLSQRREEEKREENTREDGDPPPSGSPPAADAAKPRAPAKRKSQVDAEFTPSADAITWATGPDMGLTDDQVRWETEKFRDHFRGKGEPRKDWEATWRNWMRNVRDGRFGRAAPAPTPITGRSPTVPTDRPLTPEEQDDFQAKFKRPGRVPAETRP